jgi:uncharacterized protein (DUF924 family)
MSPAITQILNFWFGEPTSPDFGQPKSFWFNSNPEIDNQIKQDFASTYDLARTGQLEDWLATPQGCLGLILLLDQFPRNMFRNTPQAFATDDLALKAAKTAISQGFDQQLPPFQRKFMYMPFMHTESLADQIKSVELFLAFGDVVSLDYAIQHHAIIERFGRFPHRNAILNRLSTAEELAFLQQPGSSF